MRSQARGGTDDVTAGVTDDVSESKDVEVELSAAMGALAVVETPLRDVRNTVLGVPPTTPATATATKRKPPRTPATASRPPRTPAATTTGGKARSMSAVQVHRHFVRERSVKTKRLLSE